MYLNKRMTKFTKILAILCIAALLMNGIHIPTKAATQGEDSVTDQITEFKTLGVEEFTKQETAFYEEQAKPTAGDQSLDGYMVDGIYTFSGGAALYIGAANWGGFRIGRKGNTNTMNYQFMNNAGAVSMHTTEINAEDIGCSLFDNPIRIKLGVDFVKEYADGTTVDAKITLNIGDTYEDIFLLEGIMKSHLIGRMFVYPNGGSVTMSQARDYKVLTFDDFNIPEDFKVGTTRVTKTAGSGTLDGYAIDGTFYLHQYPIIQIGQRDGMRVQIHINGAKKLAVQFLEYETNAQGTSYVPTTGAIHTSTTLGCEYLDTDLRIRVGFMFSNKNEENNTVDLTIDLQIGPTWKDTITVEGLVNADKLTKTLTTAIDRSVPESYMICRSMKSDNLSVTPKDFQIEDGVYTYQGDENTGNEDYTVLRIEDFMGVESYTLPSGAKTLSAGSEGLDGVMFDGIYQLSMNPVIDFGGTAWAGLQFQRTKDGAKFQFLNTVGGTVLGVAEFTTAETGGIYDTDVRIKVAFDYTSEIVNNKVDADITITVGNITKTISIVGANTAYMKRAMYWSASDAPITMKTTIQRTESVSGKLTNLHSASTGVMTLNGKRFSADVQFEGTDSQLRIGGTDGNIWDGAIFRRVNDRYFAFGNTYGMKEILVDAVEAGLHSTNERFHLEIGFKYESLDTDFIVNDVKYGILINGKLYAGEYLYSKNDALKFGTWALAYCPHKYGNVAIYTEWQEPFRNNTPYLLEDFGIENKEYTVDDLPKRSYSSNLGQAVKGGSSITGKVALKGDASLTLYGAPNNEWFGLRFRIESGKLVIQNTESNVSAVKVIVPEVTAGNTFTFCVEQELLDLDADGLLDDIRFGVRINGTLYGEERFYLLDFAERSYTRILLYVGTGDAATSSVTVKESVQRETYNLDDTENGYLVHGEGTLTVNKETVTNGTVLSTPGDYIIRSTNKGAYAKLVTLYKSNDAHVDAIVDVRDLVAIKKASQNRQLNSIAGQKAADIDRNQIVNKKDFTSIQDTLLGIKEIELKEEGYQVYSIEDFTQKSEYTLTYKKGIVSVLDTYQATLNPTSVGTLDGMMIDGIYKFSGNASINFGGKAWQGLQISRTGTDKMRCQIVGAGNAVDITSADTGCKLFDNDVRIQIGFTYLGKDEEAGTVDIRVKICIGTTYANVIEAYGVKESYLKKSVYLYAKDDSTYTGSQIVLKALPITSGTVSYLTYEDDVMPIVGFYSPYKDLNYNYLTDDMFQLIKDSGINMISNGHIDYASKTQRIKETLALTDKYNLGTYIFDTRYDTALSATELAEYQKDFATYTSYKGVYVVDEPFTEASGRTDGEMMVDYVDKGAMLNSYSNTFGYINSGPKVDDSSMLYRDHIHAILESKQKIISWDFYPFDSVTDTQWYGNPTRYFSNLAVVRKMAYDEGKPFWGHIQAGSYWENSVTEEKSTPSEAELLWNVNTSLAYGVKGIQYFPMLQPPSFAGDYEKNSLIDVNGNPTKWYGYAKTANKQIAEVDEYLLYANSLDILAVGSTAQSHTGITKTTYGDVVTGITASGGAVVGVFDYQGRTALYVANYDAYDEETTYDPLGQGDAAADDITLSFGSTKKYTVISTQLATANAGGEGTSCTLSLNNGGAALILID